MSLPHRLNRDRPLGPIRHCGHHPAEAVRKQVQDAPATGNRGEPEFPVSQFHRTGRAVGRRRERQPVPLRARRHQTAPHPHRVRLNGPLVSRHDMVSFLNPSPWLWVTPDVHPVGRCEIVPPGTRAAPACWYPLPKTGTTGTTGTKAHLCGQLSRFSVPVWPPAVAKPGPKTGTAFTRIPRARPGCPGCPGFPAEGALGQNQNRGGGRPRPSRGRSSDRLLSHQHPDCFARPDTRCKKPQGIAGSRGTFCGNCGNSVSCPVSP